MSFIGQIFDSIVTNDQQRSSGNKARDAQERMADQANDLQRYMYDQTRQDNLAALQSRDSALNELRRLLGIGGDQKSSGFGSLAQQYTGVDLAKDPGYQFGLNQGTQALERSAAARGGLYSGATMKALQRYGQDYAGTKFNEGFNRYQAQNDARANRLLSLAGLGQAGSSQVAAAGQNYANQVGGNLIGLGNVNAANIIGQGNRLSNGTSQLTAWAMNQNRGANWGGNFGGSYNSPTWWGGYDNPYGDTYDYRGSDMPDSMRGGQ